MKNNELTTLDHQNMDAFLSDVLDDYKNGVITKNQAIAGLAHVMAALDRDNYEEARTWFVNGRAFVQQQ